MAHFGYFLAKYNGYEIACDAHKVNVISYMEDIRGLNRSQYSIEEVPFLENSRSSLVKLCKGYYVPSRDADAINAQADNFMRRMENSVQFLAELEDLCRFAKRFDVREGTKSALESISRIYSNRKLRKRLLKKFMQKSDILTMPIGDYLVFVRADAEHCENMRRWKEVMHDKTS